MCVWFSVSLYQTALSLYHTIIVLRVQLLIQIEAAVLKAAAEGDSAALRQIHHNHPRAVPASRNNVGSVPLLMVFVCKWWLYVDWLVVTKICFVLI